MNAMAKTTITHDMSSIVNGALQRPVVDVAPPQLEVSILSYKQTIVLFDFEQKMLVFLTNRGGESFSLARRG